MHNIDDKSINLLRNLDHISLGELSPPSSYDFIRYSRDPLLDTRAEFPSFENVPPRGEAFGMNFSNPSKDFRQYLETLIQDAGEVGTDIDEWYRSSAESLVGTALDAGRAGKKVRGSTGYVLMSDINEDMGKEEFREKCDIPDYFLQNSDLNSEFYVFEGVLDGKRDVKIASITEDETAVAWFVGRTLERFDMDEEFKTSTTKG